jgi:TetR/AcrR family transcriptional regulator, regulator of cefoperazone and chloramphenicol sensitivity
MISRVSRSIGRRGARTAVVPAQSVPKRVPTKELLIETAERLFGQLGIDGVSLREVAAAAGQSNNNVVQYHFKDKAGLVGAILEDRVSRVEALRRECLDALPGAQGYTPLELLRVLWLPILSVRDVNGWHTFGRFLLQYMLQPEIAPHPVRKLYRIRREAEVKSGPDLAYVAKAMRLLRLHYRHLPPLVLKRRVAALSLMFLASVVEHDNARLTPKTAVAVPGEFDPAPILEMALGALSGSHE